MKKTILIICLFFVTASLYAQKEFWGLTYGSYTPEYEKGTIFKTDSNGAYPLPVHLFDSINGMNPYGRLFQASNGKLYGTASYGGTLQADMRTGGGVLFEYDLITDVYRVVNFFNNTPENRLIQPLSGVIEPVTGILYGSTINGIYKYAMATGVCTYIGNSPQILEGSLQNPINGELVKASDGNVYGATQNFSACPNTFPFVGSVLKLNTASNVLNAVYPFACNYALGRSPQGSMIEAIPGKLYGTGGAGGDYGYENLGVGDGVIFEYDIATNTYTKKYSFNAATTGAAPGPLVLGNNGKLYGVLGHGGINPLNPAQEVRGSLFEYDIATNTVTVLHYFVREGNNYPTGHTPRQNTLLRSSDGNFYGINNHGIFKFDPDNNTVTLQEYFPDLFSARDSDDLIEICRKPRYVLFDTDSFTLCSGTPFTFDVHNTNATSYVWKKGGIVVTGQTTGVLNFSSISLTDSGVYTCEMTNECGVTVTPPIIITVNQSTSSTITSNIPTTGDVIMLCPETSVTLSGNNGGTWNTGATTPAIEVTEAGDYQITNTNSCGDTYSNIVTVQMYEVPNIIIKDNDDNNIPPGIIVTSICIGAPITLYGNTGGGVWQDGSTGTTFTTNIALNTDYYVTTQHECGTYTSNIIRFTEADITEEAILPVLTPLTPLDICNGGIVGVSTNRPEVTRNYWVIYKDGGFYMNIDNSNRQMIALTEPGTYVLERSSSCFGSFTSAPITITESNEPPATPVITVNGEISDFITLCNQESITLTSSAATGNIWSTGETTQSIEVSESGSFGVRVSNGCGESNSNFVTTYSLLPDVTISMTENNTLTVNEANATYQWLQCSIAAIPPVEIAGAISQSFTPTEDGLYAVRVTNQQGCTATSQCFRFGTMGTPHDIAKNSIILYPNPAKEKVTLQTSATIEKITIVNMLGQTVSLALKSKEIDVSQLSQGQYILIAQTNEGIWRGKFVKN